jgi:glycosyltransferase involved in cell wall biosynthesis
MLPNVRFVSTFGERTNNVMIVDAMPHEQMRPLVQRAAVYLATARETFGIGTLEALAAGVPVAGWRYGGQEEIIVEGETGYLAPYGDYEALAVAVSRCLDDRDRLSQNCLRDARARWGWQPRIAQYAAALRPSRRRVRPTTTRRQRDRDLPQPGAVFARRGRERAQPDDGRLGV